jgi:hypothetical protein
MQLQQIEHIARVALRELGAGEPPLKIEPGTQPDRWRIDVGGSDPVTLNVRAGSGTTAQFVREQIFAQFAAR